MSIRSIHPFPARMAPEIAIAQLKSLRPESTVIDPMMGSGTVLRQAVALGHRAIGFDMDPLAVLMSGVWSTPVVAGHIDVLMDRVQELLCEKDTMSPTLPWIDNDRETLAFTEFWFGLVQRTDLRRLSYVLSKLSDSIDVAYKAALDVLRIALSRVIITKSNGASLAWDVSHSRPHRVMEWSNFEVMPAFKRSVKQVKDRLASNPKCVSMSARVGDARLLADVGGCTSDMVLTSPPYLNAIDYMRGHKLSLVWLGYTVQTLRAIRGTSVGAERRTSNEITTAAHNVQKAMVDGAELSGKHRSMVERYALDLTRCLAETARVLKYGGTAVYVVGNSCVSKTFILNSAGVTKAAQVAGLTLMNEQTRDLPISSRYLPMPEMQNSALGKRMRTESILIFSKPA